MTLNISKQRIIPRMCLDFRSSGNFGIPPSFATPGGGQDDVALMMAFVDLGKRLGGLEWWDYFRWKNSDSSFATQVRADDLGKRLGGLEWWDYFRGKKR
ncbi:hypothetical protein JTE90_020942 [Oedothorax gibbosus]|uniref:Uncharacterized protein n=1 Tax=Oedothorax gibbosus TaxID=931172 RepID=A0AAV6VN74_9ARAC|nr:hypothetical protein JTE90_020942 [Oedothorax gibbosus]